jgi:hypothetical protein
MRRGGWMATNVISWRVDDLPAVPNILGVAGGWGGGAINDKFAEKMYAHEPNSQRRIATFLTPDELLYDETLCGWPADTAHLTLEQKKADPSRGINAPTGAYSRCEYMAIKKMTLPTDKSTRADANMANFVIARLGEAYLLYAEACLKSGNTAEGKKYLNKIQERAGAPVTDLTMETLMDEKQYEMWFEGCRFFDLVRWNKQDGLDIKALFDAETDNIPYLYDLFFVPKEIEVKDADGNVSVISLADIHDPNYYQKEHKFVSVIKHPLAEKSITNRFIVGKNEYLPFPEDALNLNPMLKQHPAWANSAEE